MAEPKPHQTVPILYGFRAGKNLTIWLTAEKISNPLSPEYLPGLRLPWRAVLRFRKVEPGGRV